MCIQSQRRYRGLELRLYCFCAFELRSLALDDCGRRFRDEARVPELALEALYLALCFFKLLTETLALRLYVDELAERDIDGGGTGDDARPISSPPQMPMRDGGRMIPFP